MQTESATLVDVPRLERYLNATLPGPPQPLSAEKHVGGFSNETFYVQRGEAQYVLRRPPRGPLLPTSHDVGREYRFLSALRGTAVRIPQPLLYCEDLDVIGAPFYLMERMHGVVIQKELPAALASPDDRRRIGEEMIDALAELHGIDWQAAGLTGNPQGYLDRQLRRWQGQADLTVGKVRDLPGVQEISGWLVAHKPASGPATIVHGDYSLHNVMFAPASPARLIAILDWEMATIGDPLTDLGYMMHNWGVPDPPMETGEPPVSALPGFLTREQMAERYARKTGREMRDFTFYHVLALWKTLLILEGLYVLYKEGTASNPDSAEFEQRVPDLIRRAHRLIERA